MSPLSRPFARTTTRFPRVSGDEPMEGIKVAWNGQFSPCERG